MRLRGRAGTTDEGASLELLSYTTRTTEKPNSDAREHLQRSLFRHAGSDRVRRENSPAARVQRQQTPGDTALTRAGLGLRGHWRWQRPGPAGLSLGSRARSHAHRDGTKPDLNLGPGRSGRAGTHADARTLRHVHAHSHLHTPVHAHTHTHAHALVPRRAHTPHMLTRMHTHTCLHTIHTVTDLGPSSRPSGSTQPTQSGEEDRLHHTEKGDGPPTCHQHRHSDGPQNKAVPRSAATPSLRTIGRHRAVTSPTVFTTDRKSVVYGVTFPHRAEAKAVAWVEDFFQVEV